MVKTRNPHDYVYIFVSVIILGVCLSLAINLIKNPKSAFPSVLESENSISTYDYKKPVPASAAVNDTSFAHTAFLGSSSIDGFMLLSGIKADEYAAQDITVTDFMEKGLVYVGKDTTTLYHSMKGKTYDRIYLLFGQSELKWKDSNQFINGYKKIIHSLKSEFPKAQIYVQAILPINETKMKLNDGYTTNQKIDSYNKLINKMISDEKIYYVDIDKICKDKNGQLMSDASTDGINLTKDYCVKWYQYLKTHVVK